jgi:hypothetical protein
MRIFHILFVFAILCALGYLISIVVIAWLGVEVKAQITAIYHDDDFENQDEEVEVTYVFENVKYTSTVSLKKKRVINSQLPFACTVKVLAYCPSLWPTIQQFNNPWDRFQIGVFVACILVSVYVFFLLAKVKLRRLAKLRYSDSHSPPINVP